MVNIFICILLTYIINSQIPASYTADAISMIVLFEQELAGPVSMPY